MKKRVRILSVLLCVAMVGGLAACGSKKEDKKNDGNEDGKINIKDLNRLYEHITETNPLD